MRPPAAKAAGQAAAAAQPPGPPGDESQAGTPLRILRHGMLLDYRYVVYNARAEGATGRPRVTTRVRLLRDGRVVFTGKVQTLEPGGQDAKRLAAGGRLLVGPDLVPGEYILEVTATDALAKGAAASATQWMDFEVIR